MKKKIDEYGKTKLGELIKENERLKWKIKKHTEIISMLTKRHETIKSMARKTAEEIKDIEWDKKAIEKNYE